MDSLTKGSEYSGFTVTDILPLPELSGFAYTMRHAASGARALWIACDDENKSLYLIRIFMKKVHLINYKK